MAQLLIPPPPENARISQILPTVKCSTCNQPVPISELGDHICPPAPIVKPPMSPRSTASILSQKYHSLVSRPSTPQAQSHSPSKPSLATPPTRQSTPVAPPPRVNSPNPPPQSQASRTRSTSSLSSLGVRDQHARPERTPSPLSKGAVSNSPKVAFPSSPGPASPQRSQRTPSPLATHSPHSAGPPRVSTPLSAGRKPSEPPPSISSAPRVNADPALRTPNYGAPTPPNIPAPRPRAPSRASLRHAPPPVRQPAHSSPVPPLQPVRNSNAVPLSPPSSSPRPRATTNIGSLPPINTSPDVIYTTTTGSHAGPPHPNYDPRLRAPPASPFSPYRTMSPVVGPGMSPMQGPFSPVIEVDTKSGGEAGMAGVGRRGFAAAARAAMFAQSMGPPPMNGPMNIGISPGMTLSPHSPDDRAMVATMDAVQSMDGRRPNAPKFLDINSVRNYGMYLHFVMT